jgi:aspartate/methionine/tyrosine aminotransferase
MEACGEIGASLTAALLSQSKDREASGAASLRRVFEAVKPSGGFYSFPKVPERFGSATAFVEQAISRNVLVIPGNRACNNSSRG